jgi:hypothetical protein
MVRAEQLQRRVQASKKGARVRAGLAARRKAARAPIPVALVRTPNSVQMPVHVVSEANRRDHWGRAHDRSAGQRRDVGLVLTTIPAPALPLLVTFTTINYGAELDDDNLARAFKAVRDEVARWLGCDDGDRKRLRFAYDQKPGETWRHFGIVIAWGPA